MDVLVIDSSSAIRQRVCLTLQECDGITVQSCSPTEAECLEAIGRLEPGCVVVDIPVDSPAGFQLLETLRKAVPQALLVVLCSHDNQEFRERSRNLGVDHFLHKLTDLERLVEIVQDCRGRR